MALFFGSDPVALPAPAYLGAAQVFTPPPDWPADAVAVWLILGQSNASGWAPYEQDPAKADPAAAVPALAAGERMIHEWARFTPADVPASATGGQFSRRGLATPGAGEPRTAAKMWSGGVWGIPDATPSFGPEVGLVRHVLGAPAARKWRDDADPRLYVLKATLGGTEVDAFRHGGRETAYSLGAIQTTAGVNLAGLAAAGKSVLIQGAVVVIGEADANLDHPGGGAKMGESMSGRLQEYVRQVRALLGCDFPVALVEVFENGADRAAVNGQLAAAAAEIPNATLISGGGAWGTADADTHYDGAAQGDIGRRAFAWIRDAHGRPGDGLVVSHPFSGFRPAFLLPPMFTDDTGSQMEVSGHASVGGRVFGMVLDAGSAPPSAADLLAAASVPGKVSDFTLDLLAAGDFSAFTGSGTFAANTVQDAYFILSEIEAGAPVGAPSAVHKLTRGGGTKIAPDLAVASAGAGAATATWGATAPGTDTWAVFEGDVFFHRPEDIEAGAFRPVLWGQQADHGANYSGVANLSGLTPGALYTFQVTTRRRIDTNPAAGLTGETRRAVFTAGA
ncbi:hypothetical protein [Oceanicella actignis]|uniref:Uncharacterized protein n=1 Tax=Oceanicella actignis TaxID=1189325 RepID=A0A1M7U1F7_9RHOB|nr:hypothetical protein [Oceanicella actignis]SES77250.1 hypothetical protein SAMN04488119_101416 [Oceanicella actignis]SHN76825.1 hypothetical protein SAMN05216200_1146 [Oceanicella actignis]